ncbi:BglG family transcription antiterminator [Oribacterium sp. P6A1]|uniref:BglG family transcription antiterminator n=1 Tax=Oribacterium sp. P6A1 TaxID=1410612 RepID=UPI000565112D|nr:HTH domain-containing protein [Oribacterium sp. P6A1]
MELTNRQIYIISYLLNNPEGMNADHLASKAGISFRTLQTEIRDINKSLQDGAAIINVGKHGYAVRNFSEKARETILAQADDRQTMLMPEQRVNDILSALLFEKDYISMEALAGKLFLSKGTVFRTIENSSVLKKLVTVNRTKGLMVDLPEFQKRQYLSKVFDRESAEIYAPNVSAKYKGLDGIMRTYMAKLFVSHQYHVSGEALRSFRRYMILSLIRSSLGYTLEQMDHGLAISSLMNELMDIIHSVTGMSFSESEKQDLQAKLNELPAFLIEIPETRRAWIAEWEPKYRRFIQCVRDTFGLEFSMKEDEKQRFLLHVYKLHQRADYGHHISNYYKREINRTYVLATQIVLSCFEKAFGFKAHETEVTFIALYVAMAIRFKEKPVPCIIVTSKNPSLVWPMKQWIEEHFPNETGRVMVVEHYLWLNKELRSKYVPEQDEALILTASASMALSCPEAVLVKLFALDNEYELISKRIKEIKKRQRDREFEEYVERYVRFKNVTALEAEEFKDLPELINGLCSDSVNPGPDKEDDFSGSVEGNHSSPDLKPVEPVKMDYGDEALSLSSEIYEFVLDTDSFLVPRVHMRKAHPGDENSIQIIYLEKPVLYRGTNIRSVVISDYYTETNEMISFYNLISEILKPGKIDELRLSL